jgi:hypothetical protein
MEDGFDSSWDSEAIRKSNHRQIRIARRIKTRTMIIISRQVFSLLGRLFAVLEIMMQVYMHRQAGS